MERREAFEGRTERYFTDFSEALAWVKDGGKAARQGWMEPRMHVDPSGGAGRDF